jgi:transcriptional regulator with XRE-family HTH domain
MERGKVRRNVLLGKVFRQARKSADVSQEELGFEAKVHRNYISELENGHESPTVEDLFGTAES